MGLLNKILGGRRIEKAESQHIPESPDVSPPTSDTSPTLDATPSTLSPRGKTWKEELDRLSGLMTDKGFGFVCPECYTAYEKRPFRLDNEKYRIVEGGCYREGCVGLVKEIGVVIESTRGKISETAT